MEKTIKVLHTEWSDGWGGQEIRILNEMLAVRERGVEVYLACRQNARILEKALEQGIPVFTLPFQGNTDLKTFFGLMRIIRREKIDIVNTHSGKDTWVGGLAAKLAGAKFIRTRHLSNPINPSRLNFINSLADFIFTTGESVREDMIGNNGIDPDKILSIPTGIDEKRFDPHCCDRDEIRQRFKIPKEAFVIGNLAVLRGFKRHDLLIDAFEQVHKLHPETMLLIAGEGRQRHNLEKKILEKKLQDSIRLLGHTDAPEVFLKALDLFILSSDDKEGVPQSLIQALMMGLPCIATDVGSVRDLYIKDNFLLIEPGSAEAISRAVLQLLSDSDQREIYAKNASKNLKKFTQSYMTDQILATYHTLLEC